MIKFFLFDKRFKIIVAESADKIPDFAFAQSFIILPAGQPQLEKGYLVRYYTTV
jgi:hypothetical protein